MRFMVRAPVGTSRQVTFKNPGDAPAAISLVAVDDCMETLTMTDVYGGAFSSTPPEKVVESRWLEAGIGNIKVYGEGDKAGQAPTVEQFREMVSAFAASNAAGLIIDIRGNTGGADAISASLLGSFYDERTLYEYQNWYNADTGKMEIVLPDEITGEVTRGAGLYIEPAQAHFTGPVIAL